MPNKSNKELNLFSVQTGAPIDDESQVLKALTQASAISKREAASYSLLYKSFRQMLSFLQEQFHSTGRFDDANVKLDEISKLLFIKIHEHRRSTKGKVDRLTLDYLKSQAQSQFHDPTRIASTLRSLFEHIASKQEYLNPDGTSIFGPQPTLNIQPSEDKFAASVVQIMESLPMEYGELAQSVFDFDVINEAFGHFIRNNFRHTKEDAQYMTPPEVVNAMVDMAFIDILSDPNASRRLFTIDTAQPYIILDPTCGVGSFLVSVIRRFAHLLHHNRSLTPQQRDQLIAHLRDTCIHGQDKVDRMVRLAKLNLMLWGGGGTIHQGNSILGQSFLDKLHGHVDLILTNPPFGAAHSTNDVLSSTKSPSYQILQGIRTDLAPSKLPARIDSELLVLDRSFSLLRPGGRLLIILPDKVVSSKGFSALIRKWLSHHALLRAVIELPTVTFAQAGTRTKTDIVYLQKLPSVPLPTHRRRVFMAVCEDIGYKVVNRVGNPQKIHEGSNQLKAITQLYRQGTDIPLQADKHHILSKNPPAVSVDMRSLLHHKWTPGFYNPKRLLALTSLANDNINQLTIRRLGDIAKPLRKQRRTEKPQKQSRCISVKHVRADGTIDFAQLEHYHPKSPGNPCYEGDVLFSTINPRIPRVCVVPPYPHPLTCSPEFEILQPKQGLDSYLLVSLLLLPKVQAQIAALTSGTSSSHNRIKDTELAEILVPLPLPNTPFDAMANRIADSLRAAIETKYAAEDRIQNELKLLVDLMDSPNRPS